MTIGPVQLLVIGFEHGYFQGELLLELQRLRDNDLVRVIDALAVSKDDRGTVDTLRGSQLSGEEHAAFGAMVAELLGLGPAERERGAQGAGPEPVGSDTSMANVDEEAAWDVLADIPNARIAVLILVEHRWVIPIRDAVTRAGGFRLAAEFVSPLDLIALGMLAAEEAEQLEAGDAGARLRSRAHRCS